MARLLVVDDEQSMRVMLEARLAKAGHAVEVAPDFPGVERALADFEFDVVITDLRMRTGQDGLKVLRKVKDAQVQQATNSAASEIGRASCRERV